MYTKSLSRNLSIVGVAAMLLVGTVPVFAENDRDDDDRKEEKRMKLEIERARVNVVFKNLVEFGIPEQDVFVESATNASQVVRVEGSTANLGSTRAKMLFAAAAAVPHDPFKLGSNPLGPYSKGTSLGMTFGAWMAAQGSGTYVMTKDSNRAALNLSFSGLVPNGVYTLLCSRVTLPPNASITNAPCGAVDGSENSFTASATGRGSIKLTADPLLQSTTETLTVLAVAYHSDGKTYGGSSGDFGLNTHVQLGFVVPPHAAKMYDAECMVMAVERRDTAMLAVVDAYYQTVRRALETRRSALTNAWAKTNATERRTAVREAWKAYDASRKKADAERRKGRQGAWKQFRDERCFCGPGTTGDEAGEGQDARL